MDVKGQGPRFKVIVLWGKGIEAGVEAGDKEVDAGGRGYGIGGISWGQGGRVWGQAMEAGDKG